MKLTSIVILSVVGFLLAYDFVIYLLHGDQATLSYVITKAARQHMSIPFFAGVLAGHLFLNQKQ